MKEVENVQNNLGWLKEHASSTLYMEDIEFSISKLNNILDLYDAPKNMRDGINDLSFTVAQKRVTEFYEALTNPKMQNHVPTETASTIHTTVPDNGRDYYLETAAKVLDYIDELSIGLENKPFDRRVLNVMRKHIKLVTTCPHYLDAIKVNPAYLQVIESVFATFPIPFYASDKFENGQMLYMRNNELYNQLVKSMNLIEILEDEQNFFENYTVDYVASSKNGTLDEKKTSEYYDAYKLHQNTQYNLMKGITSNISKNDKMVKDCKTFSTADYDINFKDRFETLFEAMRDDFEIFQKKGWPMDDYALLSDVKRWFDYVKTVAHSKPGDKKYNAVNTPKCLSIYNDMKPVYDNLINTTVTDNKTRKKLLTDFNKKFAINVKKQNSANGLTAKTIENAIAIDYKPFQFVSNLEAKYKKSAEELGNKAIAAYNSQSTNIDKLKVAISYTGLAEKIASLSLRNGRYDTFKKSQDNFNKSIYELKSSGDASAALNESFYNLYPVSYEGRRQMFLDIGKLYAELYLEVGKEREEYYKYIDENDPHKEAKINYIVQNVCLSSSKERAFKSFLVNIYYNKNNIDCVDLFNDYLASEGKNLNDLSVREVNRLLGFNEDFADKLYGDIMTTKVKPEPDTNFVECVKALIRKQYPDANEEEFEDEVNVRISKFFNKHFPQGIIEISKREYIKNLSNEDRLLYEKGAHAISKDGFSETNNLEQNNAEFKAWSRGDGTKITYDIIDKGQYDSLKKEVAFLESSDFALNQTFNIKDNLARLKSYQKTLNDNTHWYKGGSSRNFDKMMTELKRLITFTEKLDKDGSVPTEEQSEEYIKLANSVLKLADYYLVAKSASTSAYAATRVALVRQFKNNITNNIKLYKGYAEANRKNDYFKFNEIAAERNKIYTDISNRYENAKNYSPANKAFKKSFMGNKYNSNDLGTFNVRNFSASRTAVISISVLAMLNVVDENGNRKYSFDDVMNPDKLIEEKQSIFESTLQLLIKTASEDPNVANTAKKKLADIIYQGQKASHKVMDELMASFNTFDDDVLNSDIFAKMLGFSTMQNDVWQEMKHVKDDILELAKKDHPDIETYQDYKTYITKKNGPLPDLDLANERLSESVNEMINEKKINHQTLIANSLTVNVIGKYIKEWYSLGKPDTFSEWFAKDENKAIAVSAANLAGNDIFEALRDIKNDDLDRFVVDATLNGSYFHNVRFNPKKAEELAVLPDGKTKAELGIEEGRYNDHKSKFFVGLPSINDIINDYRTKSVDTSTIREQSSKARNKIKKDYAKSKSDFEYGYIHAAENAISDIEDILISGRPLTGLTYETAKAAVRNIVAYRFLKEFTDLGYKGKELPRLVNGAMRGVKDFDNEYFGIDKLYDFAYGNNAKELVRNNPQRIFEGKAALAIGYLEGGKYENNIEKFITDAAYASAAQMLRVRGKIVDPKSNREIAPDKYVKTLIKSDKFRDSLKSEEPNKWLSPRAVLKRFNDDKALEEALKPNLITDNMIKENEKLKKTSDNKRESNVSNEIGL
ncbi:MAG: hypothetical protein II699_04340 [Lachnospiraceae bacterium]|nr:hypothetical protein [Lachnospiraceae bacterium]